jgi:hypothetical protein
MKRVGQHTCMDGWIELDWDEIGFCDTKFCKYRGAEVRYILYLPGTYTLILYILSSSRLLTQIAGLSADSSSCLSAEAY